MPLGDGVVGVGQIGRAADGRARRAIDDAERHLRGFAASRPWASPARAVRETPASGAAISLATSPCRKRSNSARLRGSREPPRPGLARGRAARAGLAPAGQDRLGDFERRRMPTELLARGGDLLRPQRRAMRAFLALLAGRAIADHRAAGDHRRARIVLRPRQRLDDLLEVVTVDAVAHASRWL